nr:receptor-like protein kinase FERONIA [Ipomoea trifida]
MAVDKSFLVVLSFVLLALVRVSLAADYVPTDKILLNCGGPDGVTDQDNRKWTTDVGSKFLLGTGKSSTSSADSQKPSVPQVPFMTARTFQSEFTYSFPVAPGRKFLRLYFYPASYNGLNATNSLFSVRVGEFTLLKNFSAAQTTEALNFDFVVKEFSINVGETLNVTFTPSPNSPNSFAFVNGIEVVSHPDIYNTADGTTMIVGQNSPLNIDNSTALESVYRVNVGGNVISPSSDTGMFRSWDEDSKYIFSAGSGVTETADDYNMTIRYPAGMPTYVAPVEVYKTLRSMGPNGSVNANSNLTWYFSVDSGFFYLVRLHFCEFTTIITKVNQRVFIIYLNNQTAETEADAIAWAGNKNGVPTYQDYGVFVPKGDPQVDLWLALHPKPGSNYLDAILNGLEIFKVSDTLGNLAGLNPVPSVQSEIDPFIPSSVSGKSKNHKAAIGGGIGGGIAAALVLIGLVICVVSRRRSLGKDTSTSDAQSGWLPLSLYGNSHSAGSAKTNTTGKESGKGGLGGIDIEEGFDVTCKGKKDPDASPGFDASMTDSRSSGISMSIGGRSLASEDSDGLTPSAVFSQIMNPKGR